MGSFRDKYYGGQQSTSQDSGQQTQPNPNAAPWSNAKLGGANWLGDILFPRAAAVSHMQAQGQEPSIDQRLSVLGEAGNRIIAPFFGPLGLALGGITEGATQPGTNLQQRVQGGLIQGAMEGGGGFALNKVGQGFNVLRMLLNPNKTGQIIPELGNAATQTGVTDSAPNVLTEIKQAVESKFAPRGIENSTSDVQSAFGNVIKHITGIDYSPRTFANMQDFNTISGNFTPSDLIKARQTIPDVFGYNPEKGNIQQKIAEAARDVLSKRAKDITPGLAKADTNYVKALKLQDIKQAAMPWLWKTIGLGVGGGLGIEALHTLFSGNNQSSGGGSQP